MAAGIEAPTGKHIGATTKGATGGTALAGAVGIVLVWVLSELGVDVPDEVHGALIVIIAAVGTIIGGKLSPTDQVRTIWGSPPGLVTPPPGAVIPDGDGEHRATTPVSELDAEVDAIAARAAAARQDGGAA